MLKIITKRVHSYKIFLFFTTVTALIVFFYSSIITYKVGNIFFGQISKLYNVEIAQFFFKRSAHPILGTSTPFAHYQLSRTYFIQGNFLESIKEANKELEIYPDHCRTHYIRGLTYGYMNRLDKAIDDFKIFNESCVKNSWAGYNDLAWFYFRNGDMENMKKTIEPMVKLYPNNPWVQNTYGLSLLNLKDYKNAKIAFTQALSSASLLTENGWGSAYPGNNPDIYGKGLSAMRATIQANLELASKMLQKNNKQP